MINLGTKTGIRNSVATDGPKGGVSYPEFSVDGISLPISSKDVGRTITATVQLKVKKAGEEIGYDNKKKYRANFCVVAIDISGKRKVDPSKMDKSDLDELEYSEYKSIRPAKKGYR